MLIEEALAVVNVIVGSSLMMGAAVTRTVSVVSDDFPDLSVARSVIISVPTKFSRGVITNKF
jgi:hypothetical protein